MNIGRANISTRGPVFRVRGWDLNTYDIEDQIARLEEIAEVMILDVHDKSSDENVAAIVKLSAKGQDDDSTSMTIRQLRDRLSEKDLLPMYKMPTVLKILSQ